MLGLLKKYISLNSPVDDKELELIVSCFKPLKAKRNALLCSHGETCDKLYFVNKGCLRVY